MNSENWSLFIFPVAFIVIWVCVIGLISLISGWGRLAKHYSTKDMLNPYQGKKLRGRHGRFGATSYSGVLTFGTNMQGMYLAVNPLFAIGHPALFIPWMDIRTEEREGVFSAFTTLSFAQVQELKTGNFF